MNIKKYISQKYILESVTAIAVPLMYFFLIGGFNGTDQKLQNSSPYNPLSVVKIDFVKEIRSGKYDSISTGIIDKNIKPLSANLLYFLNSQHIVINAVNETPNNYSNYYFKKVNGYTEIDTSGTKVLYLSCGRFVDGKKKLNAGYIADDIKDNISIKYDTVISSEWFLKPMMKIRESEFSPGDTRPVAAIIICNGRGKTVDSTVIKVRNFSDINGKYESGFIDKYMTEFEFPGNNMYIEAKDLFENEHTNTNFNIKVYWFGEVDLWFKKITIDDNISNELLSGGYRERIISEASPVSIINAALMIKNNKFKEINFTSVNYVMNVMYKKLQNEAVPFSLN